MLNYSDTSPEVIAAAVHAWGNEPLIQALAQVGDALVHQLDEGTDEGVEAVADVAGRVGLVVGNQAQEAEIDPNLLAVVNAWRHRVDLLPEPPTLHGAPPPEPEPPARCTWSPGGSLA